MGFSSAQTTNESIQNSVHAGDVQVHKMQRILLTLIGRSGTKKYTVSHIWKPVSKKWGIYTAHHSHILVFDLSRNPVLNFGLFYSRTTKNAYISIKKGMPDGWRDYKTSHSYKPNPLEVNAVAIEDAFDYAAEQCGLGYHKYYNNCQKFARIFMTQLGSKHNRNPFHP